MTDEPVCVFSTYKKALRWVLERESTPFRIYLFGVNTDERRLLWAWNLSERQCEEASILMSKPYVRTPPEMYAKALRQLLKLNPHWTVKTLAEKISRTERWVETILENNPESRITATEEHQDEVDDSDRGKLAQQHPSSAEGWDS